MWAVPYPKINISLASKFNILLNYWIISKNPRKYIKTPDQPPLRGPILYIFHPCGPPLFRPLDNVTSLVVQLNNERQKSKDSVSRDAR